MAPPSAKRRRGRWWVALGLFFAFWPLWKAIRSGVEQETAPPPTKAVLLHDTPLTGNPGVERMPAFSADGRDVAYSWNGLTGDNFDIYRKPLIEGVPVRLTTNKAEDFAPVWSPDGDTIAFLRRDGASDDVMTIPAAGGDEKKIAEIVHFENGLYGLTWKKDNQHLIVSDTSPGTQARLFDLSTADGKKTRLTRPSENAGEFFPVLSPDGQTLAFVRDPSSFQATIFVWDLTEMDDDDAAPRKVSTLPMPISHPAFTADGRQLIYAAGAGGSQMLWRANLRGSAKPQPVLGLDPGGDPIVSIQGRTLLYSGNPQSASHPLLLVENFR
jgi:Tol biopolymer transport system component